MIESEVDNGPTSTSSPLWEIPKLRLCLEPRSLASCLLPLLLKRKLPFSRLNGEYVLKGNALLSAHRVRLLTDYVADLSLTAKILKVSIAEYALHICCIISTVLALSEAVNIGGCCYVL